MRIARQQPVCEWVGALPQPPRPLSKLGLALSTLGQKPIHGLRLQPTETTNGWYVWCGGEMSDNQDFFSPLHVEHIKEHLPAAVEYLNLPPGYRFLIDGENFEDVWFDASLLEQK